MGVQFFFFFVLCARGRGGSGRGGIGGGPITKWGSNFFFLQLFRGPEGPSRWLKATSPPQELEVGAHRAPYLLVCNTNLDLINLFNCNSHRKGFHS